MCLLCKYKNTQTVFSTTNILILNQQIQHAYNLPTMQAIEYVFLFSLGHIIIIYFIIGESPNPILLIAKALVLIYCFAIRNFLARQRNIRVQYSPGQVTIESRFLNGV